MIEIKRKEGESTLSAVRRFSKKVQQSGNLAVVRSLRFAKRPSSKLMKKRRALKRLESRARYARLEKLGQVEPAGPRRYGPRR